VHTRFVELDVALPASASALLEVVEQAFQQRLAGQGEVLRWAITALDIKKGSRTVTVQAVVLEYAMPPLDYELL
jgi:hypothetical protein